MRIFDEFSIKADLEVSSNSNHENVNHTLFQQTLKKNLALNTNENIRSQIDHSNQRKFISYNSEAYKPLKEANFPILDLINPLDFLSLQTFNRVEDNQRLNAKDSKTILQPSKENSLESSSRHRLLHLFLKHFFSNEGLNKNVSSLMNKINKQLKNEKWLEESKNELDFIQAMLKVKDLLNITHTEKDIEKLSPKIIKLIRENLFSQINSIKQGVHKSNNHQSKGHFMLHHLIKNIQNNLDENIEQQNATRLHMNVKKVEKWLKESLKEYHAIHSQSFSLTKEPLTHRPYSNIQQYLLHLNDTSMTKTPEQQLMKQIQPILRAMPLTPTPQGQQLWIKLQPEHLGEIVIQMTEVKGETTLKMLVSSQTTKQILKANIHELRNLFSPHQVMIEEREFESNELQSWTEEFADQEDHQNFEEEGEQEEKNTAKDEEEFGKNFFTLLMNERGTDSFASH